MGRVVVSTQQSRIVIADVAIGFFATRFEPSVAEAVGASDGPLIQSQKSIADAPSVLDLASLNSAKPLTEAFVASEAQVAEVLKSLIENVALSDGEQSAFDKALADSGVVQESAVLENLKAVSDIVNLVDDDIAANLVKTLAETPSAAESLVSSYVKSLSDSLSAEDDDALEVLKGLSDLTVVTQALALSFGHTASDTADITDGDVVNFGKTLSDELESQESFARTVSFFRSLNDNPQAAESLAFAIQTALGDDVGIAETIVVSLLVLRAFDEAVTVSDVIDSVSTIKSLTDPIALNDLLAMEFVRIVGDEVTTPDTPSLTFETGFSDSAQASDIIEILRALGIFEDVSVADSGTLVSQGYADVTYFLEDYVGSSLTF